MGFHSILFICVIFLLVPAHVRTALGCQLHSNFSLVFLGSKGKKFLERAVYMQASSSMPFVRHRFYPLFMELVWKLGKFSIPVANELLFLLWESLASYLQYQEMSH